MRLYYIPYTIFTSILFAIGLPVFRLYSRLTGRHGDHFSERLGRFPWAEARTPGDGPRIWIHAVSLGEVKVAMPILTALDRILPGCTVLMSTITKAGRTHAEHALGKNTPVFYAPLDVMGPVQRSLDAVKPDILIFLETEIWPTWVRFAQQAGIRTILIHGRISARSITRYRKAKFFFREVLENFDAFSMITQADAQRIMSMGADPEKIEVNGSAKYDFSAEALDPAIKEGMRKQLFIGDHDRVFIAGSIRGDEAPMILHVFDVIRREFPDMILLMAPRHIKRVPEICSIVENQGMAYQLWSDLKVHHASRTEKIVIINTTGDLFNIYSLGSMVFVGGSLVPLGGQNPVEPAVWGKPVFFGPHMENFIDAKSVLEAADAACTVHDPDELAEKALNLLNHPEELIAMGERARTVVKKNQGAAMRHAEVIKRVLELRSL